MQRQSFDPLADVEPFSKLDPEARAAIAERLQLRSIERGEILVRQGEYSDSLYVVVTGRFSVCVAGIDAPIAEIASGQPVGEIAFFAGGPRTATVRAERDSVVFALSRPDFEALAERLPELWPTVARTLATRLAETTGGRYGRRAVPPKTLAVCRAGRRPLQRAFRRGLLRYLSGPGTLILDSASADAQSAPNETHAETCIETARYNDLEKTYDLVVYVCDDEVTSWSQKALHQADQVLLVADAAESPGSAPPANELERLAASLHDRLSIRLALVHRDYAPVVEGTGAWLDERPFVGMHHHVAGSNEADIARLMRFMRGEALGLVASGGGAFTAAHIGMIQALQERGYDFDIYGGTSGGAAMAAAFASGVDAEIIDRHTHEMFVRRCAMGRWNVPWYSLLDHKVFDACLAEYFPAADIADLWVPYFAVATNLSRNKLEVIQRGPLWKAIRASAAIPALFPPVFSNGEMLVDGCLIDNVPIGSMRNLKQGPNVVVDLVVPGLDSFDIDTSELPSRTGLFRHLLLGGKRAPDAPGPQTVLLRSLLRESRDVAAELEPEDLLLAFPVPEGASVLDWTNHGQLRWSAYDFARERLSEIGVPEPTGAGAKLRRRGRPRRRHSPG